MDIKAKIIEIFDTVRISDKFQKREFAVEYAENPSYPEYLKFELIQDKCDLLDQYKVGQQIHVHFNLKGRKWTDPQGSIKYFNTLQAWKITADEGTNSTSSTANEPPAIDYGEQKEPDWLSAQQDPDDLPF